MGQLDLGNLSGSMKRYDVDEIARNLARTTASLAMAFHKGKGKISEDGMMFIPDPEPYGGHEMIADELIHCLREKVETYRNVTAGQEDTEKIERSEKDE